MSSLDAAVEKMEAAGIRPAAIASFVHSFHELETGATGLVPEDSIDPVANIPSLDDLAPSPDEQAKALDQTVAIRLNGGLDSRLRNGLIRGDWLI